MSTFLERLNSVKVTPKAWYTKREAVLITGKSPAWLHKLAKRGEIQVKYIQDEETGVSRVIYSSESLEEWMEIWAGKAQERVVREADPIRHYYSGKRKAPAKKITAKDVAEMTTEEKATLLKALQATL